MGKYTNKKNEIIVTIAVILITVVVAVVSLLLFNPDKSFSPPNNWLEYNANGISFSYPDDFKLHEDSLQILTNSSDITEERITLSILPIGKSEQYSDADSLCNSIATYYKELESDLPSPVSPFERNTEIVPSGEGKIKVTDARVYQVNKRQVCEYKVSGIVNDDESTVYSFFLNKVDGAYVVQATIIYGTHPSSTDIESMDKVVKTINIDDDIEFQEFVFPSPN